MLKSREDSGQEAIAVLASQIKELQEGMQRQSEDRAFKEAVAAQAHADEIKRLKEVIAKQAADLVIKHNEEENMMDGSANSSRASTKARWAIVIEEGRDSTEAGYVDVMVNGRSYRINRGVVAEVPPEVIGVLKDAIVGRAYPIVDATGVQAGVQYRQGRRFPFRTLGKAIDENGQRIKAYEIDRDSDALE